jgi:hypothetical protein
MDPAGGAIGLEYEVLISISESESITMGSVTVPLVSGAIELAGEIAENRNLSLASSMGQW